MSIGCHPSCPQKLSFKFESNKVAISLRQSLVLHPPKVPQDSPQHDFGRFGKGLPRNSSKLVFQILFYFLVLNQGWIQNWTKTKLNLKFHSHCVNQWLPKLPPNPPKIPKTLHSTTLGGLRKVCDKNYQNWSALTSFRECETKFNSKFESKVPISVCQSAFPHGCGGLREAVSMRGGSPPQRGKILPLISY